MKLLLLLSAGLVFAAGLAGCGPGDTGDPTAPLPSPTVGTTVEASPTPVSATPTPSFFLGGEVCKPPREVMGAGATVALAHKPFCVAWRDSFATETGFRIELRYLNDPDQPLSFTYLVAADIIEFVFPAADGPRPDDPAVCRQRGSYSVEVWARSPSGDVSVGAAAVSGVHCAGSR